MLFVLLCTHLVAKTREIASGSELLYIMPKHAGLCKHVKPRGDLTEDSWTTCCCLLMNTCVSGIFYRVWVMCQYFTAT